MFDPGVKLLNTVPGSDFNKLSDTSNPPTLSSLDCWLLVVNCLFASRPGYGSCLTNPQQATLQIAFEVFNQKKNHIPAKT